METSAFGKLNKNDIVKGVIVAILTALVASLYNGLETGGLSLTWLYFKPIVLSSLGAGLGYLLKNVLTNSNGQIGK
jgi:hypothetical protein